MPLARATLAVLVAAPLLAAGCGKEEDEQLPAACKAGPLAYQRALAAAPEQVRLDGTPLSDCFIRAAGAADVQTVGASVVGAAALLAEPATRDPGSDAALRLGYLAGAVERGTRDKQGIYAEAVRRLDQELDTVDRRSAAFRRGERASLGDG